MARIYVQRVRHLRQWLECMCVELLCEDGSKIVCNCEPTIIAHYGIAEGLELDDAMLQVLLDSHRVLEIVYRLRRFLSYRLRSTVEVLRRLRADSIPDELQQHIIEYLTRNKFLDDSHYARSYIRERVRLSTLSAEGIRHKLRLRGIAPHIITEALEAEYNADDEIKRARVAAQRAQQRVRTRPKEKQYRLVYSRLLRQGFTPETIRTVLTELFASHHSTLL